MGWIAWNHVLMGPLLTALLIGIGSNLDNCGVGIAYGSHHIRFPHYVNAIMNGIGFCTALLGAYAGTVISRYLPSHDASIGSCVVLCAIGLFFWYVAYVKPFLKQNQANMISGRPGIRQGIILGLALSFTNIASGFGATVSGTASLWITVVSITIWGYIMVWIGNVVGIGVFARWLGRYSSLVAGLVLIGVGLHQII